MYMYEDAHVCMHEDGHVCMYEEGHALINIVMPWHA